MSICGAGRLSHICYFRSLTPFSETSGFSHCQRQDIGLDGPWVLMFMILTFMLHPFTALTCDCTMPVSSSQNNFNSVVPLTALKKHTGEKEKFCSSEILKVSK
ncbi:unnamed protein product [Lepidochelys kempii]